MLGSRAAMAGPPKTPVVRDDPSLAARGAGPGLLAFSARGIYHLWVINWCIMDRISASCLFFPSSTKERTMSSETSCPFSGSAPKPATAGAQSNADWWPRQLNLKILHQHGPKSDPMGAAFDYAKEFRSLDL